MKPYGKEGKTEIAKCGCCPSHHGEDDYLKWRNVHRRTFIIRDKKRQRQKSKYLILRELLEL